MAKRSAIEWTEATWNPWHGCKKISPGCKFCYMFREKRRYGQNPAHVVRSKTTFKDPLKWPHQPIDCFTCSWSDFFIEAADEWRGEAWAIMKATPRVRYLVLTKRTDRILEHLPADWGTGYANVMLGASVENDEYLWRLMQLCQVPSIAGHFASLEPLLGPLSLANIRKGSHKFDALRGTYSAGTSYNYARFPLSWVIVGGESGEANEDVRPLNPGWVRALRDECVAAGVPFFFKQWGEWAPTTCYSGPRNRLHVWSSPDPKLDGHMMERVGKIAAGRLLDGREWNEKPARIDVDQLKFEEARA